tara:strand:- start:42 stop:467 length:426 start_codon:yes stop_codon:yes gene_type:complete
LSDDNKLDDEWNRVINNPQNVIVSDSLRSIIDTSDFNISEAELTTPPIGVKLLFDDDTTITGEILFFEKSPTETKVTFSCPRTEAIKVFSASIVTSVTIKSEHDDIDLCIETPHDSDAPTISFDFDEIDRVRSVGNLIIKM